MNASGPLPLRHSWPLGEQGRRFDLGLIVESLLMDVIPPLAADRHYGHRVGCWECDLGDNSLIWSGGVYDIFGLPRGCEVARSQAVALYSEDSRAKMEALRAHAIRHRRGFTLDAEIRPQTGGRRWIRLICAPVLENNRPVRLHGLKFTL